MGSQCHTESQETSWWQLGLPTPPTVSLRWSYDLWGEKWTAPHWWRVNTAAEVQEVPLTVQCTIHSATKLKTTEPFDFPQSENCLHRIFLRCWVHSAWGKFSCLFQDQKKKHQVWAVGVCVGEQYASLLQANKSLEWFLGRSGLLIAKRRMFGPESIIS